MSDKFERTGAGCAFTLIATLAVGWVVFVGWMIWWVVSWVTNK